MVSTDHLGNTFSTQKEKCSYWGVGVGTYNSRIKNGCSEEEALTGNIDRPTYKNRQKSLDNIEARTGLTGKVYETEKAMFNAEAIDGIDYGLYKRRQAIGWTKKKALNTPKTYKRGTYEEFIEIGISKDFVLQSRNRGWSDTKIRNNMGLGLKPQVSKRYKKIEGDFGISIEAMSFETDTNVWYKCECRKCKMKDIWNYGDMLKHSQVCK